MFSDLAAVEAYLNSLINYESRMPLGGRDWPKLEPTQQAVSRLGLAFSLPNCVHIAGTKGKGSTASFLEALLAPDQPTLSFTSPHLVSFTERIRINGSPLKDDTWCEGFGEIFEALNRPPAIRLTYFESTFIFYLWAARRLTTRAHVVEAGLGGRWDATNVLQDTIVVLTLVDYDHTDILGKTLTEIAGDKSGIIKPHSRAVIARQPEEAMTVYKQVLDENAAEGILFGRDFWWTEERPDAFTYHEPQLTAPGITLATPGQHQRDNASVAIRAARLVNNLLDADKMQNRLAECVVPGRQQMLTGIPPVMVDVSHNPASFAALAQTLRQDFGGGIVMAVTGLMKDKDARACFEHLRGLLSRVLVVPLSSPRTCAATELAVILRDMGFNAMALESRDEAFAAMHAEVGVTLGLVTGSFYLAGDYLTWRQRAGIA